jgi:Holliday junction resolvase RusA-like endonuclease
MIIFEFDKIVLHSMSLRFGSQGVYTTKEYIRFKKRVGYMCRQQMKEQGMTCKQVGARMIIKIEYPRPKCHKGEIYKTTAPDYDNIVKGITDGMNKILYRDDAILHSVLVLKRYAEVEKITISVKIRGK